MLKTPASLLILVLSTACSRKPNLKVPPAAATGRAPASAAPSGPATEVQVEKTESVGRPPDKSAIQSTDEWQPGTAANVEDIFFDFDSAGLRVDQRSILERDAASLRGRSDLQVLVEGHCDDLGTVGYNMALGEVRAESVRSFLVGLGVERGRIEIISYGKERPFTKGNDEASRSQNRRAHFRVRRNLDAHPAITH